MLLDLHPSYSRNTRPPRSTPIQSPLPPQQAPAARQHRQTLSRYQLRAATTPTSRTLAASSFTLTTTVTTVTFHVPAVLPARCALRIAAVSTRVDAPCALTVEIRTAAAGRTPSAARYETSVRADLPGWRAAVITADDLELLDILALIDQ